MAIHLALLALGIGPGDEVIVPTLTYIASANSIAYTGATPVFVDSLESTWQIDPEDIRRHITPRTKAIMPVHLYGQACDMDSIMARNQSNVGLILATLSMTKKMNATVVDCAGGYGILVRLLRDRGVEALWSDPFCQNLLAVGFEYTNEKAELVTAFEAFEHFVDPLLEAEKLFAIAPNLLISTNLIATPAPSPDQWWYYGLDHGQHIGFFRFQTLQFIAQKFGKHLVTDGVGCHFFTEKPINATHWKLKVRIARKMPFLFSQTLKSKIWSDFEKMCTY